MAVATFIRRYDTPKHLPARGGGLLFGLALHKQSSVLGESSVDSFARFTDLAELGYIKQTTTRSSIPCKYRACHKMIL